MLIAGALAGSVVGGVAGFGTGITLLPILTLMLGARTAIPVLTVTMTIGNLARVWWSRHDVHPRVVGMWMVTVGFASVLWMATLAPVPWARAACTGLERLSAKV